MTPSFFFLMAVLTASDWGNLSKLSYQWFTWGLISPFTVNFWKLFLLIDIYVFYLVVMEKFGVVSLQSPQYHHWCAWNCVICRWGINMQITPHEFKEQTVITKHSNVFTWKYNTLLLDIVTMKYKANNFLPCLLIKPWVLSKNSFRLDHFVFFKNENWTKWRSCWPACIIKF